MHVGLKVYFDLKHFICTKAVFKRQTPGVFAFLSTGDQGKTKLGMEVVGLLLFFFVLRIISLVFPVH